VPGVDSGSGKSAALIVATGDGAPPGEALPRVGGAGNSVAGDKLTFSAWLPNGLAGSFWPDVLGLSHEFCLGLWDAAIAPAPIAAPAAAAVAVAAAPRGMLGA
jgi:hypothetical protein